MTEDPKAKRARVARNVEKMASAGASQAEIEAYIGSEGITAGGHAPADALAQRRQDVSPIEDFAQGVNQGLAKAGTSTIEGLAYLGDKLTGGKVNLGVGEWAREARKEAEDYYNPQGTAGAAGDFSGRLVGEGALLGLGSGAVTGGLRVAGKVLPLAARAADAVTAAKGAGLVKKIAATTLPALPLDVAIGTGAAEAEGNPNPLRAGLERGALDVAGGAVLTGAGHLGGKAIDAVTDVGKGLLDDAGRVVSEPGEGLVRAIDTEQAHRVQAAMNDPLGAEQVLRRRAAAAAEEARMAAFNARAAQPALIAGVPRPVVDPAIKGRFDAMGRPVYDLPEASQAVPRGPAPDRTVTPAETLTPQPEQDPITLATRRLEAAQGARVVADGPSQSLLGGPELMGADEDAVRAIARASAQQAHDAGALQGTAMPIPQPVPLDHRLPKTLYEQGDDLRALAREKQTEALRARTAGREQEAQQLWREGEYLRARAHTMDQADRAGRNQSWPEEPEYPIRETIPPPRTLPEVGQNAPKAEPVTAPQPIVDDPWRDQNMKALPDAEIEAMAQRHDQRIRSQEGTAVDVPGTMEERGRDFRGFREWRARQELARRQAAPLAAGEDPWKNPRTKVYMEHRERMEDALDGTIDPKDAKRLRRESRGILATLTPEERRRVTQWWYDFEAGNVADASPHAGRGYTEGTPKAEMAASHRLAQARRSRAAGEVAQAAKLNGETSSTVVPGARAPLVTPKPGPPAEAVGAAPVVAPAAPATNLFGDVTETAPTQGGLFGERAGTEASRPLAGAEAAAQGELDKLRQVRALGSLTPEQAARMATLEKLVNRGEKLTAGELATQARANDAGTLGANPTPSLVSPDAVGKARGSYADWLELNDAAERAATQAGDVLDDAGAALSKDDLPAVRPRTASGKLKKNLTKVSTEDLGEELRVWQDANASENTAPTSLEDTSGGGPQYVGKKRGAAHATGRIVQRQKTIEKIEAELRRRGVDPLQALQDAHMRAGTISVTPTEGAGPTLDASGILRGEGGEALFSNPVGPALSFGKQLLATHGTLTGAIAGAAAGAYGNDDNRVKGGLIGAAAGAALGASAMTLLRPRTVARALAPAAASALDRAAAHIDFDGSIRKAIEGEQVEAGTPLARVIGNRFWQAADYIGNAYGVIERLGRAVPLAPSKNPRDLMTYVKSSDHVVGRFFREGTVDPVTRQVTGPSYQQIFDPFGNDADALKKFLGYLKASRDVGRVAKMGMGAVGDNTTLHATNLAAVQAGDQVPLFRQQAKVFAQFVKGVADYAEGSGLWTPMQRAAFEESDTFFLPYQRVLKPSIVPRITGTGGGGVFSVTPGVKRFKGSEAAIDNPALTLAQYTQNIIRRADRYRAGSAIIDAVEALGPEGQAILTPLAEHTGPMAARRAEAEANAEAWKAIGVSTEAGSAVLDAFGTQISKENPVIWRNRPDGGREAFLINSPGLLRAAEAMNPEYLNHWIRLTLSPLRTAKRLFTATTTALSPRFAGATNPLRDAVEVFAKSEARVRPDDLAWGYAEGLRSILGMSPVAKEAVDAGLGGTSMFFHEGNPGQVARQMAPVTAADRARNALAALGTPVKGLEKVGEASDLGPRLAEYMATLRNFEPKVTAGEWTPADLRLRAATNARNVTIDFSNRPGSTVLRAFADYIPFFGVGLQAPVSFAAAIDRSPARALSVAATVGGASALAWALTRRLPPEVQRAVRDRPATERAAFLVVPTDNKGNVVRFPLGAELGLVHMATTATLDEFLAHDPHAGNLVVEGLVRALPPGVGEWASGNMMIPVPLAQQALEVAKNKTDYGDRPIVPARFESVAPAERRLETTAPTFDLMSAVARGIGGEGRLGKFSPLEAEHLTRGAFSNATPLLTSITDPVAQKLMGRGGPAEAVPRPWYQEPLNPASAVIGRNPPSGTQSENDYYNARENINFAHGAVLDAKRRNAVAEIPALREKYGVLVNPTNREIVNQADKALRVIKDQETDVTRAYREGRVPAESARDILDRLRGQRQAVYRRASDLFRKTGALR